jgi:ABC-type multidrug transport system fused ATPase/permease subunit
MITALSLSIVSVLLLRKALPHNLPGFVSGLQAATLVIGAAQAHASTLGQMRDAMLRIRELTPWLLRPDRPHGRQQKNSSFDSFNEILCRDVTLYYPQSAYPALHQVTTQLANNGLIAVVGHNGAGKSTFARLLLGQLQPTSGTIEVDGSPLTEVSPWSTLVTYVSQSPVPLDVTTRDYLTLGNDYRDEDIRSALLQVSAEWAVDKLDQLLGMVAHAGIRLSGGTTGLGAYNIETTSEAGRVG